MERIHFLGSPMDAATMTETVAYIEQRIWNAEFTQHVVVNVAKLVNMQHDRELAKSVTDCDLINIDGMGIVIGARLFGFQVPERVAGVDLFDHLVASSAKNKFPIFLLGAAPDVVAKTAQVITEKYPELIVAGYHHGYFWHEEEVVVEKIAQSGAKLLFVAITSPKKENFINKWRDKLGVSFVMGVGGTFDVVAGKVKRAPVWMQNSGLEWLFRVLQEPRRMWKRYLSTNSSYCWLLIKNIFRMSKCLRLADSGDIPAKPKPPYSN